MSASWEFTLTRDLVTADEQAIFAADLEQLGLDDVVWTVHNGTTLTATPDSIPKVLRGYRSGNLAGLGFVMECRRYGESLFPGTSVAKFMDRFPLPICVWIRPSALNDAINNPGFVAEGLNRRQFVEQGVVFLRRKYLSGSLLEAHNDHTAGEYATFPFCANGYIDLHNVRSVDDLYADSKNLKRKVNKFRNKGGEIEVIHGALTAACQDEMIRCLDTVKSILRVPFQDIYNDMVRQAATHADERIVHFIARLEGECVGYHSFARSGQGLYALSGAFDRTRHTTYHAYENLILATIDYCLAHGLDTIHYGVVANQTKAKMMSRVVPSHQRYFVRFPVLTPLATKLFGNTKLVSPEVLAFA
jgi:hypothetical protein